MRRSATRRLFGGLTAGTAGVILLWAATVSAQTAQPPPLRVAGSGSYLREQGLGGGPSTTYPKGWVITVDRPLGGGRVAIVGEVGASYRTNLVVETDSVLGILGGLRVDVWHVGPLRLFAQGIVGLERFAAPGFSERGVAAQPGGGVDIEVTRRLAIRVQGDFRAAHEEGVTFRETRAAVGLVIGLGQ